jgi:hypothetical protein
VLLVLVKTCSFLISYQYLDTLVNILYVHAKLPCLLESESFGILPSNCFAAVEFRHRKQEEIVVK